MCGGSFLPGKLRWQLQIEGGGAGPGGTRLPNRLTSPHSPAGAANRLPSSLTQSFPASALLLGLHRAAFLKGKSRPADGLWFTQVNSQPWGYRSLREVQEKALFSLPPPPSPIFFLKQSFTVWVRRAWNSPRSAFLCLRCCIKVGYLLRTDQGISRNATGQGAGERDTYISRSPQVLSNSLGSRVAKLPLRVHRLGFSVSSSSKVCFPILHPLGQVSAECSRILTWTAKDVKLSGKMLPVFCTRTLA